MILMKYSKLCGGEFISHLDAMRNIGRTLTRAEIPVNYSQGYHPHMLLYMSSPIGVGMRSLAEYCLIDTPEKANGFKEKFNEFSPKGIKCVGAWDTDKKVGVASDIVKARYKISGLNFFDKDEVLKKDEFIILNKEGKEKNVRELIYDINFVGEDLYCLLGFGNGLRAEKFAEKVKELFGGRETDIVKEEAFTFDGKTLEEKI